MLNIIFYPNISSNQWITAKSLLLTKNKKKSFIKTEQTKFLGGDVEHTHLVRGLDYALLRKIREQEKDQKELGVEEDNVPNNLEKNILDHKVKKILPVKVKEHSKEFKTSTILGENLKNLLLNPTKGNTVSDTMFFSP